MARKKAIAPIEIQEPLRRLDVWGIWLAHRLFILLGAGWAAMLPKPDIDNGWNLWFDGRSNASRLWLPFSHWDGQHYLLLAEKGYGQVDLHHQAFYPLLPWALRALTFVTHSPHASGLIFTWAASLVFARYFWLLAREWLDERHATFSLLAFFLFPSAFYTAILYTEAPFLAALVAWLYYHRKNSDWQLVPALVVPLIRAQGIFVLLALCLARGASLLRRKPTWSKSDTLGALGLFLGVAAYFLFMAQATGDALSGIKAQATFVSGNSVLQLLNPFSGLQTLARPAPDYFDVEHGAFDKLFMVVMLVGLFWVWKLREPLLFSLYLVMTYVPMAMGTGQSYFRYALAAAPILMIAGMKSASSVRKMGKWSVGVWVTLLVALQLWAWIRFARNLWVA